MAALLQIRWPPTISARYLKTLAPRAGFDLATNRLKAASNERATTNISVHLSARSAEFTSLADFIRYSLPTLATPKPGVSVAKLLPGGGDDGSAESHRSKGEES